MTEAGFPVSPETLATKASRGGGPLFQRFGRKPLYRWGDCLDWAHARLSAPMRSTSEADALAADGVRHRWIDPHGIGGDERLNRLLKQIPGADLGEHLGHEARGESTRFPAAPINAATIRP